MAEHDDPSVKRLPRGGGSKHVYDTLKRDILELRLSPGESLDETSLAERFEMSRSPVREAIVRLSGDGLVRMLPNRATIVASFDLAEIPTYIEALDFLQRANTRLAALRRSDEDISRIQIAAQNFEQACVLQDNFAMSHSNKEFHMAIAAAGGNSHLAEAYGKLLDLGRRLMHMHFEYSRTHLPTPLSGIEHSKMIDAVIRKDAHEAENLAHKHTELFYDRIKAFMTAEYFQDFHYEKSTKWAE